MTLKPLSLALQGGGAHGAFAWGVLDALLEDGRFDFRAASGASAGAMNAAVMTSGLAKGGAPEARRSLDRFWSAISDAGSPFGDLGFWTRSLGEGMKDGLASASSLMSLNPFLSLAQTMAGGMAEGFASTPAGGLSPYQFNPFNFNPLKDALSRNTDFAAVRSFEPLSLFIAATEVRTGRLKVFGRPELSVDHILASACLPYLFQAVEIGGEPYWDGGFTANPPLWPLYYGDLPRDVLVVSLNPFCRGGPAPTDMASIIDRLNAVKARQGGGSAPAPDQRGRTAGRSAAVFQVHHRFRLFVRAEGARAQGRRRMAEIVLRRRRARLKRGRAARVPLERSHDRRTRQKGRRGYRTWT